MANTVKVRIAGLSYKFLGRAHRMLSLDEYSSGSAPEPVAISDKTPLQRELYVLRMLVRTPEKAFAIP